MTSPGGSDDQHCRQEVPAVIRQHHGGGISRASPSLLVLLVEVGLAACSDSGPLKPRQVVWSCPAPEGMAHPGPR